MENIKEDDTIWMNKYINLFWESKQEMKADLQQNGITVSLSYLTRLMQGNVSWTQRTIDVRDYIIYKIKHGKSLIEVNYNDVKLLASGVVSETVKQEAKYIINLINSI